MKYLSKIEVRTRRDNIKYRFSLFWRKIDGFYLKEEDRIGAIEVAWGCVEDEMG